MRVLHLAKDTPSKLSGVLEDGCFKKRKFIRCRMVISQAEDRRNTDRAKGTASPPGADKPTTRGQKPSFLISDWRASEFWSTITWNAALPATFAIALQYIQTSSFIKVTLPASEYAPDMLFWALPTMALDFTVQGPIQSLLSRHVTSESPQMLKEFQAGVQSYITEAERTSKREHRHMPPVQRASARLLLCIAQQFALQGVVTTALMALLLEVRTNNPDVLPVLLNVPGTSTVDGGFIGTVALLATPLAMAATRIKLAEEAFREDYLERRTAQFIEEPGVTGQPLTSSVVSIFNILASQLSPSAANECAVKPEDWGFSQATVEATLSGCRLSLLTTSCCMIYMQTESVLAAAWVMFVCANFRDRMCRP